MSRRRKDQITQDRADVVAVLEEEGPLSEWQLVARILGYDSVSKLHQAWPATEIDHALRDMSHLKRRGQLVQRFDRAAGASVWDLATSDDAGIDEDRRDVEQLLSGWQEVR